MAIANQPTKGLSERLTSEQINELRKLQHTDFDEYTDKLYDAAPALLAAAEREVRLMGFLTQVEQLHNGSPLDITDSPKSYISNVKKFCESVREALKD